MNVQDATSIGGHDRRRDHSQVPAEENSLYLQALEECEGLRSDFFGGASFDLDHPRQTARCLGSPQRPSTLPIRDDDDDVVRPVCGFVVQEGLEIRSAAGRKAGNPNRRGHASLRRRCHANSPP